MRTAEEMRAFEKENIKHKWYQFETENGNALDILEARMERSIFNRERDFKIRLGVLEAWQVDITELRGYLGYKNYQTKIDNGELIISWGKQYRSGDVMPNGEMLL